MSRASFAGRLCRIVSVSCRAGVFSLLAATACFSRAHAQDQITLTPRVPLESGVANPRFAYRDQGKPFGWEVRGNFRYDDEKGFAKLASDPRKTVLAPAKADGIGLSQKLTLKPGHYLLKAVARTDNMECTLFAHSLDYRGVGDRSQVLTGPFGVPIGISTRPNRAS
jgi:hypothetical protein